jgi:hypothetical protein
MLVGQYSHCYSKSVISKPSLAQNNGIPNKFPVRAAVGAKNTFITVRYLLTRDSLCRFFYFVQENIVNHNFNTLREEDASFAAINLCSAVFVRHWRVTFFFQNVIFYTNTTFPLKEYLYPLSQRGK